MENLKQDLRAFIAERDWKQFHSPKNLAMALAVEAAELMEPFQWLTEEQSRALPAEKHALVKDELADVLIYLVRLADELNVDLLEAAHAKLGKNRAKYPPDQVRGKALKYNEY
ncbi:MAG: nucleotide pyrophosphohydrolase [Candidatus Sumerlaeaceae bacterium]